MLEKKLTPLHVWALAFGCIIGFGAFLLPGTTFLVKAGPFGTAAAMLLGALIMCVIGYNYCYMIRRYPSAGGELFYAKQAFGKGHAFFCAWFLCLSYLMLVPMNATALAMIFRMLAGNLLQIGAHYSVAGYDTYIGELALAFFTILLFGWLNIRGSRISCMVQTILTFLLAGGVFAIGAAALPLCTPENLMPWFSITGGQAESSDLFSLFQGFFQDKNAPAGMAAILAIAPFSFVGFDTIPQASEEYNFSYKKVYPIMLLAIFFGASVYIILTFSAAAAIPDSYSNWAEYISDLSNLDGIASFPVFHAAWKLLGSFGLVCVGGAVMGAALSGINGFYLASTRALYAMAKEHFLPDTFSVINDRFHTPVSAVIFVCIFSLVCSLLGRTALGWLVDMSSLGAAIGFGYTSAAAVRSAWKERKEGNGSLLPVVTGIFGTAASFCFAGLLLIPIPGLSCSIGKESLICLIIWGITGLFFYRKRS